MHAGAGSWELVKKHVGGFLWCALVCAPSPVLASPVRIRIRLLNRLRDAVRGARAEGEREAPAVAFVFLLCKEGCSITRAKQDGGES